jgi:hypothetical protein
MSWLQGVMTVFAGNLITLVPMALNAHPGAKYGIPYPVLVRSSFGIKVRRYIPLGAPVAMASCCWGRPCCPPAAAAADDGCPPATATAGGAGTVPDSRAGRLRLVSCRAEARRPWRHLRTHQHC